MKKSSKIKLRLSYNSPFILTFCIICTLVLIFDKLLLPKLNLISNFFTVPGNSKCPVPFNFKSFVDYIKLFTHVLGHNDWNHLVGNLSFILLIGPLLEERYGSAVLGLMVTITALVTGVLNACLIPVPLLGSSGIAFMLIILASFTSISKNEIPISFLFVFILFLGSEVFLSNNGPNVSVLAHVAGGLCGSMFGFLIAPKASPKKSKAKSDKTVAQSDDDYASNYSPKKEPFFKTKSSESSSIHEDSDSEETVIGTIEL